MESCRQALQETRWARLWDHQICKGLSKAKEARIYDPEKLDEITRGFHALERRSTELFGERHLISSAIMHCEYEDALVELECFLKDLAEMEKQLRETVERET